MRRGTNSGARAAASASSSSSSEPSSSPESSASELDVDGKENLYYEPPDISSLALNFVPSPFVSGCPSIGKRKRKRKEMVASAEREGLLASSKTPHYGALPDAAEVERRAGAGADEVTTSTVEAWILLKSSIPLMLTYLLQYSFTLITMFVVGRIGTDELAAVSLASMTANITGLAVYEGLATSLDTLCAQAYGSGKKTMVGLHLQRMVLLMLLVTIPIGALWLSSGWILAALVPEKEIAHLAGRYLSLLLASTPGFALFEAGKRFTQAQGLFNASLVVLCVATPINMALNYVFVFVLDLELSGAALATIISNTLLPLLLWGYVCLVAPTSLECWPGLSSSAFKNWGPMLRLALPGIIMTESEWLAFDILTFSASYLSTPHLAAQSILMTLGVAIYHVPFSVGVAVSTRLGNLIGAGSLPAARTATRTYMLVFLGIGIFDCAVLLLSSPFLPAAFTTDPVVRALVTQVLPLLALFQFFDAGTALANALLRGLGKQAVGGACNIAVYYGVAVPLALALCFGAHWGLVGLWAGCGVGSCGVALVEAVYMWFMDWEKAVDEARGREA